MARAAHFRVRLLILLAALCLPGLPIPASTALAISADPVVEIVAVGDMIFSRSLADMVTYFKDIDYPLREVAPILQAADLAIGNLETTIAEQGTPAPKRYTFRAEPYAADTLSRAGFDLVTLANNHAMDYGPDALLETLQRLRAAGIAAVGAGENESAAHVPAILEREGLRIAFLGYVNVLPDAGIPFDNSKTAATIDKPGVAWAASPEVITADVSRARQSADVVIVLLHSGRELEYPPDKTQKALARAAIDAGAAAVIGAHPHVLQGVERYNGGLIAYSLGNFVFDMAIYQSAMLRLFVGRGGVQSYEWLPVVLMKSGQPRPASPAAAQRILGLLDRLSLALKPR